MLAVWNCYIARHARRNTWLSSDYIQGPMQAEGSVLGFDGVKVCHIKHTHLQAKLHASTLLQDSVELLQLGGN